MIRRLYIVLLALSIVLVLIGCKVGQNYERPEVPPPEAFRFATQPADSIIDIAWWELFEDAKLKQLIDTALVNNQDVLIAAYRIEEARANLGFTKADIYPGLNYNGAASRQQANIPFLGDNQTFNNFNANLTLTWEIDFWGKFRRANESARAQLLASTYAHRVLQIDLIAEVTSAYFLLQDYRNRLNISIKTLRSRQRSLEIIQARFDEGIVAEIDLNQSQIQEAIAAAAVPLYTRLVAEAENALSILLGQSPGEITMEKDLWENLAPPEIPAGIPAVIIARRPDVLQAEQQLIAQNALIGVAQAQRFPAISLTGVLGVASDELGNLLDGNSDTWGITGSLAGPLFNFNKFKRQVEIERARFKQDSLFYVKTVLNSLREVENALINVSTLKEESDARFRQMESAQNASGLSRARYDGGVTSYLEVLDSERSEFNAELAASEVYQAYLNSYITLYRALGGGWIDEEERQQAQQQQDQDSN